jgi:hypothetical protein
VNLLQRVIFADLLGEKKIFIFAVSAFGIVKAKKLLFKFPLFCHFLLFLSDTSPSIAFNIKCGGSSPRSLSSIQFLF